MNPISLSIEPLFPFSIIRFTNLLTITFFPSLYFPILILKLIIDFYPQIMCASNSYSLINGIVSHFIILISYFHLLTRLTFQIKIHFSITLPYNIFSIRPKLSGNIMILKYNAVYHIHINSFILEILIFLIRFSLT